jgi:hypothetical protein
MILQIMLRDRGLSRKADLDSLNGVGHQLLQCRSSGDEITRSGRDPGPLLRVVEEGSAMRGNRAATAALNRGSHFRLGSLPAAGRLVQWDQCDSLTGVRNQGEKRSALVTEPEVFHTLRRLSLCRSRALLKTGWFQRVCFHQKQPAFTKSQEWL